MKAPEAISDNALILMADIFPTGFFAASNAVKELTKEQIADATVVLLGCGSAVSRCSLQLYNAYIYCNRPVGLCALINMEDFKPKNMLAVDAVQSRLDLARSLGAEPWNFQTDREGLNKRVQELTDGRGADIVIGKRSDGSNCCPVSTDLVCTEVVGLSPALKMGFELLRPWGKYCLW